jgi:hypothetical protein
MAFLSPLHAQQVPSVEQQIGRAVAALPEADRADAMVFGYRDGTTLSVLREGTNEFVCLGDTPGDDRFQTSCYHKGLEPFMARGRALREQGMNTNQVRETRASEVEAGSLEIPIGATIVTLFGSVDASGAVSDSVNVLRVIYLPFATAASTGLRTQPSRTDPYLMDPGQHRAHVMIPGARRAFP